MNFMVGFILIVSGGREKEAFWVFTALLHKSDRQPMMAGLNGLYSSGFGLLVK